LRNGTGRRAGGLVLAAMSFSFLGGCQSPAQQSHGPSAHGAANQADQNSPSDLDLAMDPSAARLNDISGAMLLYYATNKQLPDQLEELNAGGYSDGKLKFTSPASGKPYVYVPTGLMLEAHRKRIILYDPTPTQGGRRFCLVMALGMPAGSAQAVEILSLPENVFESYHSPDE
jgi:hypothetical protein